MDVGKRLNNNVTHDSPYALQTLPCANEIKKPWHGAENLEGAAWVLEREGTAD